MIKFFIKIYNKSGKAKKLNRKNICSYPKVSKFKYIKKPKCFRLKRKLLIDDKSCVHDKYMEKITWNDCKKKAICIGYNPARADTSGLDKTNELLTDFLHNSGYGGYYLFNLYSEVNVKKVSKKNSTSLLSCICSAIQDKYKCVDVYFFWGNSVYINPEEEKILKELAKHKFNLFTIGGKTLKFCHPSRLSKDAISRYPVDKTEVVLNHKIKV